MTRASGRSIVPATTYRAILGRVLQVARKARFRDQVEFAKEVGLSQPTLSRIESGLGNLTVDQLKQVADALDTNPAEFLAKADRAASMLAKRGVRVVCERNQSDSTVAWLGGAALAGLLEETGRSK